MKIKLVSDVKEEMKVRTKKILDGKAKTKELIVMTPETFCKVFSPKRIRLLMEMKTKEYDSISDLARKIDRKFEAVHRDITVLVDIGLVNVTKTNNKSVPKIIKKIEIPAIV